MRELGRKVEGEDYTVGVTDSIHTQFHHSSLLHCGTLAFVVTLFMKEANPDGFFCICRQILFLNARTNPGGCFSTTLTWGGQRGGAERRGRGEGQRGGVEWSTTLCFWFVIV